MPVFDYKAYGPGGKSSRGMVEAENQKAARMKLKKQGLAVYEITEKGSGRGASASAKAAAASGGGLFAAKASGKDIALMTRQLASLIKANIALVEALSAMVDQTEVAPLKVVLAQVRQDVNEGLSLTKAMGKHPRVFDNVFVNMVEAGEASGTLGLVLVKLADLKEAQMRLRSKVISGMTYPVLMMGVAVLLLGGMFAFVLPQMKQVFEGMNKPMPPITEFLMNMSDFIVNYWIFLVGGFALIVMMFLRYIKTTKGKRAWDGFQLRAPIFGSMFRLIGVTRFSSTMATLLASGVPILTAMNIAKNLVGNVLIAEAISNARENITEGQSISGPLAKSGQFPPLVIHMISIGEKTGELPEMLKNVAETYEEQVSTKIEGMTSLLEPIMIISMGGVVGFIVMAVFVPLLDMSNIQ